MRKKTNSRSGSPRRQSAKWKNISKRPSGSTPEYLDTQNAGDYLPRVLSDVLEGKLGAFGTWIGRQLFKLTVDQCLMGQELATGLEIDPDQLQKARVRRIKMVKETNGEIAFDDMVAIQQGAQR